MKTYSDAAEEKFIEGYNCAQSVLFSFCEELGLDADTALKISCGFGGGMGRKGEVCGAVTGGVMVLGLKYGRGIKEQREQTYASYVKIRELFDRFSARHSTCLCRELLGGCNLATPEGQAYFKENDCLRLVCRPCVRDAAELVCDLLAEG
ncbi:MAG: C-GCAxxG-C-C family protein [Smithellaceae bacterium]|nr:C-GCAxxG-C-C family protein [Smithellaceae bacterium]MDD3849611.1 C-GCAxxG-C-C family protein [Smithellaceae bacterium]HOG12571.1 C-GCAxxG-C-C family protein [Smithellaceae bacterium]HOQ72401.1 C-GCAxxG-C-C family protein [Smithellaceae bacterium]HPL09567.1 C-GCAxxG-C-C family protein [Smithellaceae bacterium]